MYTWNHDALWLTAGALLIACAWCIVVATGFALLEDDHLGGRRWAHMLAVGFARIAVVLAVSLLFALVFIALLALTGQ